MAAIYSRAYNINLWPRCYSSVTTDAATNCLSENAAAVKGYTVINVFPDINPRILTSTVINAGFLGQPMEVFNAHTSFALVVPSDTIFAFSGIKIPGYGQLCIGPLQTANFTFGPQGWVYTGNPTLATPVGYQANTTATQAAASQVNVSNVNVTTATVGSSAIKVPSATGSGAKVTIYNATTTNILLFPSTGQSFDSLAVNTGTNMPASTTMFLYDVAPSTWARI